MRTLPRGSYRVVEGEYYDTPKEMWGFCARASGRMPEDRARDFLHAHRDVLGLPEGLRGIRAPRIVESLGAHHVIFQQWHRGRPVHRAYVSVHMDLDGRVYLAKNRIIPRDMLPAGEFVVGKARAIAAARAALPKSPGPIPRGMKAKPARRSTLQGAEERWYPVEDTLVPAYRVRLGRGNPTETWVVYVDARTGRAIDKYDNLARWVRGRARVFDPSPVTALGSHDGLVRNRRKQRTERPPAEAYAEVALHDLRGNGRLEGKRVTTSRTARKHRVSRKHHDFMLDSHERGFEEVMAYYHIDAAIRYLEGLGYAGRKRIFEKPVRVNANGTRDDNSWYDPWTNTLTFGTGYIDDAEDGEIVLHELGHAIQHAITPNWGASSEAAAMGEGFGDYFAASFFYDKKPPAYRPCVMTWNGLFDGLNMHRVHADRWPPCQRYLDLDWTYDDFRESGDEHDNGEIWAVTLWDIREALGRDVADRIIIESHFQLDPYTKFSKGARAIMDADRNLFEGVHARALQNVFAKRSIEWR